LLTFKNPKIWSTLTDPRILSGFPDLSDRGAADSVKHKTPDTMELLYIWIEDYKNIKKQGFNFSPKHWFDFKPEEDKEGNIIGGTLHHEERNTNYPKDFFGENISNVTAIVGKNGSGKSNLISAISGFISSKWSNVFTFSIWCKKSANKYIYLTTRNIDSTLELKHCSNLHSNLNHLNYSGVFQFMPLGDKTLDLSTYSQLTKTHIDIHQNNDIKNKLFKTIYNEYQFTEVTEQITFFEQALNLITSTLGSNIYIPKKLDIKLYRYGGNFYPKDEDAYSTTYNLVNQITFGFYISILENLCEQNSIDKSKFALEKIIDSYSEVNGAINSFEQFIKDHPIAKGQYNQDLYLKSLDALKRITNFFNSEKFNFYESFIIYWVDDKRYRDKFSIELKNGSDNIIDFINELKKCLGSLHHLVSFQWEGLSFGENQALKIGSNIYNKLLRSIDEIRPILLTIDEGELGFHAEWQRKYLPLVLKLITNLFPNISFQIILTTHSPFLVSDLPKDNIIFLNKNESGMCKVCNKEERPENTFGANIHSLYRNSFFLENGLMGEFAKGKINDVIKYIINPRSKFSKKKLKECRFIIEQIGEPVLRNKLEKLLDDKLKQTKKKDELRKYYQERLLELDQ